MKKLLVILLNLGLSMNICSPIFAQEAEIEPEEIIEEEEEIEVKDEMEDEIGDDEEYHNPPPSYDYDISDFPVYAEWDGFDYKSSTDNPKRLAALQKAVDMMTVMWKCPFDFNAWGNDWWIPDYSTWIRDAFDEGAFGYQKDRIYKGVPYSQKSRYYDDVKWRNLVHSSSFTLVDIQTSSDQCSKGVDCSSFVSICLRAAGASDISLTTSTIPTNKYLREITGDTQEEILEQLQPGDIALRYGHCALYAGRAERYGRDCLIVFEAVMDSVPCKESGISLSEMKGYRFYTLKSYDNPPDPHTIKYELKGGTNNPNNPSSYHKEDVTLLEPTREGYVFEGWYTDSAYTKPISTISVSLDKDLTVYAKWSAQPYPIQYVLNGGINNTGNPSTYTKLKAVTLKSPTRDGYKFAGWYSDKDYTTKITSIASGNTGEKTVYAKWTPVTYKISYILNSGKNDASNPKAYTIESTINLLNPTRKGYEFKGWYLDKQFETKINKVAPGMFGNKTLYAKWEAIPYAITYNLNGGINSELNPEQYTVKKSVTFKSPVKNGYTFKGWYKDEEFATKKVTSIPKGSIGKVELYAKWSINTYTITYNLNKGKNPIGAIKTFTVKDSVALPTPVRSGYSFAGWYTDSKFVNRIYNIPSGSSSNVKLYAKWVKN